MKRHTHEDKLKAVEFALKAPSLAHAAKSLKMSKSTLHSWVKEFRLLGNNAPDNGLAARLKQAEKQIKQLSLENEILKKYEAFLSKQQETSTDS